MQTNNASCTLVQEINCTSPGWKITIEKKKLEDL